jgi:aminoglycoside phosphotransferase
MPDGIQIRGPNQFRAQVRRNGVYQSKTFETLSEATQWRRITDGQAAGEVFVDVGAAKRTTLNQIDVQSEALLVDFVPHRN